MLVSYNDRCVICELEPMNGVKETISRIMCRETELFVFLLFNELNKRIKAYVEK